MVLRPIGYIYNTTHAHKALEHSRKVNRDVKKGHKNRTSAVILLLLEISAKLYPRSLNTMTAKTRLEQRKQ